MRTKITDTAVLAEKLNTLNNGMTPYFRDRMISEGMVKPNPVLVKGEGRGRPVKLYKLTPKGAGIKAILTKRAKVA